MFTFSRKRVCACAARTFIITDTAPVPLGSLPRENRRVAARSSPQLAGGETLASTASPALQSVSRLLLRRQGTLYCACGTGILECLSSVSGGIRACGRVGTALSWVCRLPACFAHNSVLAWGAHGSGGSKCSSRSPPSTHLVPA